MALVYAHTHHPVIHTEAHYTRPRKDNRKMCLWSQSTDLPSPSRRILWKNDIITISISTLYCKHFTSFCLFYQLRNQSVNQPVSVLDIYSMCNSRSYDWALHNSELYSILLAFAGFLLGSVKMVWFLWPKRSRLQYCPNTDWYGRPIVYG